MGWRGEDIVAVGQSLQGPGKQGTLVMKYALLTKREVKKAGYWPSSFLHFYGPRRS